MSITNKEKWNSWVDRNKDDYGKACVDTARGVMELLDKLEDGAEFSCHDLICQADKDDDLTGFMAGCVAQMVWECHSRGNEFRKSGTQITTLNLRKAS